MTLKNGESKHKENKETENQEDHKNVEHVDWTLRVEAFLACRAADKAGAHEAKAVEPQPQHAAALLPDHVTTHESTESKDEASSSTSFSSSSSSTPTSASTSSPRRRRRTVTFASNTVLEEGGWQLQDTLKRQRKRRGFRMGPAERALLRDEMAAADELQLRLHVLRAAVATRQEAQWAARRTPKQGGFKQQQNGPAKGASVEELWRQKRSGDYDLFGRPITGHGQSPVGSGYQPPAAAKLSTDSPFQFKPQQPQPQPQPQKKGWTPGVPTRAPAFTPAVAAREVTLTVKMCPTYSNVLCLDASVTVPGGGTMAAVRAIIDREIAPHMAHINAEVATVMQAAGGYQFLTTDDVTVYGQQEGTKDASSCLVLHQSRWYIVLVPQQQQQFLPKQIPKQLMLQGQTGDNHMYCNAGHAMEETSCMDGAYAQGGWQCDLCGGGCGVGFGKRWCCKLCTVDYCFSCRASANEATGGPAGTAQRRASRPPAPSVQHGRQLSCA
jgi:hypothetical protein